jgi:titin
MILRVWHRRLAYQSSRAKLRRACSTPFLAVELLEDRLTPSTFWVSNTNDSGAGSLRQAIIDSNACPGVNAIRFSIAEQGVQRIAPSSSLPTITGALLIDGSTEPGYSDRPLIELDGSNAGNSYGLTITSGNSVVRALDIHSFQEAGISLSSGGHNLIAGDYLGVDPSGTQVRGNAWGLVVAAGSDNNVIGGLTPEDRNLVSGNSGGGMDIYSSHNTVEGNFIGTDITGAIRLGNGTTWNSIYLSGADNLVGGTLPGARNVIVWNTLTVVAGHQIVQGNYIGTDVTGTLALLGAISTGGTNLIGGTETGAGNVIVGALDINSSSNSSGAVVQGNYIGTDATGTRLLGANVTVRGQGNLIGGTITEARNIISGINSSAADPAVNVLGDQNQVQGNYIGTDVTGTVALGNQTQGIALGDPLFGGGNDNLIGGTDRGAGNLVSGNGMDGIAIYGSRNIVQGNLVGTDASGTHALGNGMHGSGGLGGIAVGSSFNIPTDDNLIGGTQAGAGNLVSGNLGVGISVDPGQSNTIQGNYVGTDVSGTLAIPNAAGMSIWGSDNQIGGVGPGAGNLISGNRAYGLVLVGSGHRAEGNLVGTDATGSYALANGGDGVTIDGTGIWLGGAASGAGNLISGNGLSGVRIEGAGGNWLAGNWIGTDITGRQPLGNGLDGVQAVLMTNDDMIGGPAVANTIAFNGRDGVHVDGASAISIRGNAIFSNENLGIELANGGNHNQEFPVLNSVIGHLHRTIVTGTLTSAPNTTFTIELFANSEPNPSGYGEGERYLGSTTVTTDADGVAQFTMKVPRNLFGQWLSATATDPAGNTSQFSACVAVNNPDLAALAVLVAAAGRPTAAPVPVAVPAAEVPPLPTEAPAALSQDTTATPAMLAPAILRPWPALHPARDIILAPDAADMLFPSTD